MTAHEPLLKPVPILDLRPTQITVGFREVEKKRKRFKELSARAGDNFLGRHMIPSVLGPKGRHYIIDNHHLARALHEDRVEAVLVTVVWSGVLTFIILKIVDAIVGLRVTEEEEREGLDVVLHGERLG